MQSLSDFKRKAVVGAKFIRRFPENPTIPERIAAVAHRQSNAVVFPIGNTTIEQVKENPHQSGCWFYFPKAGNCFFENGVMTVKNDFGSALLSYEFIP